MEEETTETTKDSFTVTKEVSDFLEKRYEVENNFKLSEYDQSIIGIQFRFNFNYNEDFTKDVVKQIERIITNSRVSAEITYVLSRPDTKFRRCEVVIIW